MSQVLSPATGRAYGLARVARVWRLSRATLHRHRAMMDGAAAAAGPAPPEGAPTSAFRARAGAPSGSSLRL